ncbi:MAG TPA: chemotaxis protein CheW [Caulobacteraceae bacterium]|jgi:purine-binding chemotaxis protein CheW|nr:chemotaxis protein CheW [Caulobacteraceae bacterium]
MADRGAAGASRFLTFRLRGRLYALPAGEVAEVIRPPPVARVPHAPRALRGLGNLRGAVLPIASGRALIGQEDAEPSRAIVLTGPAPVALAVDAVEGLVAVAPDRIATDPAALVEEDAEQLRGAFETGAQGEVARILDVWPMLQAAFVQAPRAIADAHAAPAGALAASPSHRAVAGAQDERERLVTFDLAGQEFGLPLGDVGEIIPLPASLLATPLSESLVLGVAAHRETLLPILSLRGLLGLPPAGRSDGREKVLVVALGEARVGLAVDRVRAIVPADAAQIEPTPAVLLARSAGEARIKAIWRGEGGRRLISILSKDQLFREDVMQRLARSAGALAPGEAAQDRTAGDDLRFLVFRLGDDEFALPIETVDEVARVPDQITRVPKTPKFLEGVMNLRGEVLPVIDQRRRFEMPPAPDLQARRLVVVRTREQRAGLIVDSVSEVLRSHKAQIDAAPRLAGETTALVRGVINLEAAGRMVLVLDPSELLTRAEHGVLEAFQAGDGRASN